MPSTLEFRAGYGIAITATTYDRKILIARKITPDCDYVSLTFSSMRNVLLVRRGVYRFTVVGGGGGGGGSGNHPSYDEDGLDGGATSINGPGVGFRGAGGHAGKGWKQGKGGKPYFIFYDYQGTYGACPGGNAGENGADGYGCGGITFPGIMNGGGGGGSPIDYFSAMSVASPGESIGNNKGGYGGYGAGAGGGGASAPVSALATKGCGGGSSGILVIGERYVSSNTRVNITIGAGGRGGGVQGYGKGGDGKAGAALIEYLGIM